jgi:hypothetical protein
MKGDNMKHKYDTNKFVKQTGLIKNDVAIAIADRAAPQYGAVMTKCVTRTEIGPSLTDFVISVAKDVDTSNASFNLEDDLRMHGIKEIKAISAHSEVYGARVHLLSSNGYTVLVNVPHVNGALPRVMEALKDFKTYFNSKSKSD